MKVIIVAIFILFLIGCATPPVSRDTYEMLISKKDSMPKVEGYEASKYQGYYYYMSTNRIRIVKVYRFYR